MNVIDRDHPCSDEQLRRRHHLFDYLTEHRSFDDGLRIEELRDDIADTRLRYIAFQYSHGDSGGEWASLGHQPADLISNLMNEEYWYAPHEVIDLDTGHSIRWTTPVVLGAPADGYGYVLAELDPSDQIQFLGLSDDDPSMSKHGRCDTCGAPCNSGGCMNNPDHEIARH